MIRSLHRLLPIFALLLTAVVAHAQQEPATAASGSTGNSWSPLRCGAEMLRHRDRAATLRNTALLHPELHRKVMEPKSSGATLARAAAVDSTHVFNVYNGRIDDYDEVTARLVWAGTYARIWLDVKSTNVSNEVILQMARALDSATPAKSRNPAQGIIRNDVDVFGPVPENLWTGDHMTEFLLTDIQETAGFSSTIGFFDSWDQDSSNPYSNGMNLLYIDSREGLGQGMTTLLSTVAHEFQHLLHYARNSDPEPFFDEGCAEEASVLNGYFDRDNGIFMDNTNVNLFRWSTSEILLEGDYERALTFAHYLREQFGERFLYELVGRLENGMDKLTWTLSALGLYENPYTAQMLVENFAVANFLGTSTDPRFGYRAPIGTGATARIQRTYDISAVPADTSYRTLGLSGLYIAYDNPTKSRDVLRLVTRSTSSPELPFTIFAIQLRDGKEPEVRRLGDAGEYTIDPGSEPYDKLVLAIIGTSEQSDRVRIRASRSTLGVHEASEAVAVSGLEVMPNPAAGSAAIWFSTSAAGAVTVELFDAMGRGVRKVVDAERFEAGAHQFRLDTEGLAAGCYMVRVTRGDGAIARPLVVAR